jgi:hypothetical protein
VASKSFVDFMKEAERVASPLRFFPPSWINRARRLQLRFRPIVRRYLPYLLCLIAGALLFSIVSELAQWRLVAIRETNTPGIVQVVGVIPPVPLALQAAMSGGAAVSATPTSPRSTPTPLPSGPSVVGAVLEGLLAMAIGLMVYLRCRRSQIEVWMSGALALLAAGLLTGIVHVLVMSVVSLFSSAPVGIILLVLAVSGASFSFGRWSRNQVRWTPFNQTGI